MADVTVSGIASSPTAAKVAAGTGTVGQAMTTTDVYKVPNDGRILLIVSKTGSGSIDVTVETPYQADGLTLQDRVYSLGGAKTFFIGPFDPTYYNDAIGRMSITTSGACVLTPVIIGA